MTDHTLHAFTAAAMERVRVLLQQDWDRDGAIARAAVSRGDRDPAAPRSHDDFTAIVCGMLAAGATKSDVVEYLRGEEVALLGAVRSPPSTLGAVGRAAWLAVRGRTDEEVDDAT